VSIEEIKDEGKEKARDKSGDGDGEPGFLGRIGEGVGQYRVVVSDSNIIHYIYESTTVTQYYSAVVAGEFRRSRSL